MLSKAIGHLSGVIEVIEMFHACYKTLKTEKNIKVLNIEKEVKHVSNAYLPDKYCQSSIQSVLSFC